VARLHLARKELGAAAKLLDEVQATQGRIRGLGVLETAETLRMRGKLAQLRGQAEEAAREYEKAFLLFRETLPAEGGRAVQTIIDLGNALLGLGRLDPAADAYHRAIELMGPNDVDPQWGRARNNLGVVASPRDFARLGWLWLNEGRWAGREVVPVRLFRENVRPQVPASLPRAVSKDRKPDDYLGVGTYGGGTNQTPHGPGVYGFNFWFNAPTPAGARVWPAAPPDTYQANGMWNRDTLTVFPSLRMVVAVRGAQPGKFEPGAADSAYDQNMRLLVEAATRAR